MFVRKTVFALVCILLLSGTMAVADIGFSAYSFESLFEKSDCVVAGEVIEVDITPDEYTIKLSVEETLLGSASGEISIVSPMANGLQIDDIPYLGEAGSHILFLAKQNGGYSVTNGIAGVASIKMLDDIKSVADAYSSDNGFFIEKNIKSAQELYSTLHDGMAKRRMLESMKEKYSDTDNTFLGQLINSGEPYLQSYGVIQAGYAGIASLRTKVEDMCAATDNTSLQGDCLYALAQYADESSLPIVLAFLDSPVQSVRSNAVLAAGVIGTEDILEPLKKLFRSENDIGERVGIVTALSRANNTARSKEALEELKRIENNELVLTFLDDRIGRLK